MRSAQIVVALFALFAAALPGPVLFAAAQEAGAEMPPLPPPRPDRAPSPPPPASIVDPAVAPASAIGAIDAVTTAPQEVTLGAVIAAGGEQVPQGLVWRVFDTRPDERGELALVAKSEDAVATLNLLPGEYVVHVAYGRAQTSDNLVVGDTPATKTVALDAGALRLSAAVTGDIPVPANLLRFDVFTAGSESSRVPVAEQLAPNEIVTLNAGTYHVVSHFGRANAVVRADLRVEPGQLTDATLYHQASQVSFKLVSAPGGEAIADVEWTVQDTDGNTLFTELGAFPSTVLAAGDYQVLARRGETVFNREFEVQPGSPREIEVLTQVY